MPLHEPAIDDAMRQRAAADTAGVALLYVGARDRRAHAYERAAWMVATERLARLKGLAFGGAWSPGHDYPQRRYYVPDDTLLTSAASTLGVRGEQDLFGGVVPHGFIATKAITQPLVDPDAAAPEGWSNALHADRHEVVLRGYTVFSVADARVAAERLLRIGPFRTKPVHATGGRGQQVVHALRDFEPVLAQLDEAALVGGGLVLEENLESVVTHSVGRLVVGALEACYYGTQHETTDNSGQTAYGGSELTVVRGGYEALLALPWPDDARLAIDQARVYDGRARAAFPAMIASRSNYDVAQGIGADGRRRSGVLEQSWRIGGATPAELLALEALAADPGLECVRTRCRERYGRAQPPPGADVFFAGEDPLVGPVALYAGFDPPGPCAAS